MTYMTTFILNLFMLVSVYMCLYPLGHIQLCIYNTLMFICIHTHAWEKIGLYIPIQKENFILIREYIFEKSSKSYKYFP